MNRRVIGVLVAVVLAAIGTFVLVNYVRTAEDRALEGQEPVDVLVVRETVSEGTPAEEIEDSVETERVPRDVRAAGGVASLDDLEGRVAAVDLIPGEQVVADRFVDPAVLEAQEEVEIPEGMQQVTFPVNQERSVGGQVRPGDTVGFIASFSGIETELEQAEEEDAEDVAETIEELSGDASGFIIHKALVTRVQTDAQPEGEGDDGGDDGTTTTQAEDVEDDGQTAATPQDVGDVPPGTFLVTLAVEAGDAEKVVFTAEYGTIWLTLEPEDASEEDTQIQSRDTIYE